MQRIVYILSALLIGIVFACRTPMASQPNGVPGNPLNLHAALVTPNDVQIAWSNPAAANNVYRLVRNGTVLFDSLAVPKSDTSFIYKDSGGVLPVSPEMQYTYKLYRVLTNDTAALALRTLDTSKDVYNWNVMNVGKTGALYDVWSAGNPNSVWLVGGGRVDSAGNNNGWEVVHYLNGQFIYYNPGPACYGVYGTSDSSIYFAAQSSIVYYNGSTFTIYWFIGDSMPYLPNTIFGAVWVTPDGQNVWAAGDSGVVVHRDPTGKWTQMQDSSTMPLQSIAGFSPQDIYFAGGVSNVEGALIHYNGTSASTILQSINPDSAMSVYNMKVAGDSDDSLYVVGNGIYHRASASATGWQNRTPSVQNYYAENVCTNGWNNVAVCGDYGMLIKFDGLRWVRYGGMVWPFNPTEILFAVRYVGNDIFAVGTDGQNTYFIHGQ